MALLKPQREDLVPLCNRVDPYGKFHAVSERGLFTGNRGIIHDPDTRSLLKRRWTTKAWIICALDHPRGAKREPMGRNGRSGGTGWTELFFADEVTALAAGHRPCFYCRREAAKGYVSRATGDSIATIGDVDASLHRQRLASGGRPKEISALEAANLPDGVLIAMDGRPFAVRGGNAMSWSFAGYGDPIPIRKPVQQITPELTVAVLRSGYQPIWATPAP